MGCDTNENGKPPATLDSATNVTQAMQALEDKKTASAPVGDKSIPFASYQELNSGKQLFYAYQAASTLPIDYDKASRSISRDYARESDEFKKRDLLTAIKPALDAEIEKAKQNKYYYMDINAYPVVEKYNFEQQAFKLPALADASSMHYFNDFYEYKLKFTNVDNFNNLKVIDENVARNIEGLRSKGRNLEIRVYFFANDTELGEALVKAQIMKVELLDKNGNLLAEI